MPLSVDTCHLTEVAPVALALKLAGPAQKLALAGLPVTLGAVLTVSVAALDVTAGGQEPLTTTSYVPASDVETEPMVNVLAFAPLMLVPLCRHWYARPVPLAVTEKLA